MEPKPSFSQPSTFYPHQTRHQTNPPHPRTHLPTTNPPPLRRRQNIPPLPPNHLRHPPHNTPLRPPPRIQRLHRPNRPPLTLQRPQTGRNNALPRNNRHDPHHQKRPQRPHRKEGDNNLCENELRPRPHLPSQNLPGRPCHLERITRLPVRPIATQINKPPHSLHHPRRHGHLHPTTEIYLVLLLPFLLSHRRHHSPNNHPHHPLHPSISRPHHPNIPQQYPLFLPPRSALVLAPQRAGNAVSGAARRSGQVRAGYEC
jgi:hypothetical protein